MPEIIQDKHGAEIEVSRETVEFLLSQRNELRTALESLLNRCASLDQSPTHDGLQNCDAIAQARAALANAKD